MLHINRALRCAPAFDVDVWMSHRLDQMRQQQLSLPHAAYTAMGLLQFQQLQNAAATAVHSVAARQSELLDAVLAPNPSLSHLHKLAQRVRQSELDTETHFEVAHSLHQGSARLVRQYGMHHVVSVTRKAGSV